MADAAAELERASADIPLTREAREVLTRAAATASARGPAEPTRIDVLTAILQQRGSLADQTLRALDLDPEAVAAQLPPPEPAGGSMPLRQLLVNAGREAQVLGHYQVDSIHILLAMMYSDSPTTAGPLQRAGLTMYDLRRHLQTGAGLAAPTPERAPARPERAPARPERTPARPDGALRRKPWPSLRGVLAVSPVFGAIVALTAVTGVLLWTGALPGFVGVLTITFVVAGWITSLCIHEFGHALVAYLGGDRAVATSGYLTLDPLRYTNLMLSVVLPIAFLLLGGIGLPGGAVYINRAALRSRTWDSAVSVAGPLGTLLCGLLIAIVFVISTQASWITTARVDFFGALAFLGFIEAVALLLNLLPIPGLDGFGILRPWLPYSVQDAATRFGMITIIGVFIVLWYVAPVRDAFFQTVLQLTSLWQIDPQLIGYGQLHMRLR